MTDPEKRLKRLKIRSWRRIPAESAIPSSSPIRGRMGEMIIVWLADENTSSQSVNTIR